MWPLSSLLQSFFLPFALKYASLFSGYQTFKVIIDEWFTWREFDQCFYSTSMSCLLGSLVFAFSCISNILMYPRICKYRIFHASNEIGTLLFPILIRMSFQMSTH